MASPTLENDELIAKLNRKYERDRGIRFSPATGSVVAGADLEATGNRSYGQNVFVSTGPRFEPEAGDLHTGMAIPIGAREPYPQGQLRCDRSGGAVVVAVYAPDGRRLSRELRAAGSTAGAIDEGAFAWFGPVEDICTPWSDNDPSVCQVITVHRLRVFASGHETSAT